MRTHKNGWLLGGAVLLGMTVFFLNRIETPHPWIYSAKTSTERLLDIDEDRRWWVTHEYGALCATSLDIKGIGERGVDLPKTLQDHFFDGAAHHQRLDLENIERWISDIQVHIPSPHRSIFYDGIMRLIVMEHGATPDLVMARAEDVSELSGDTSLSNGIRIGLQQAFGHDMPDAIQLASAYPSPLHPTLFEELGWRWGDEHDLSSHDWSRLTAHTPTSSQCSFAEGMVRGRILSTTRPSPAWWPEVEDFMGEVDAICQDALISGIAEAILITADDESIALIQVANRILDDRVRTQVVGLMQKRAVNR